MAEYTTTTWFGAEKGLLAALSPLRCRGLSFDMVVLLARDAYTAAAMKHDVEIGGVLANGPCDQDESLIKR